MERRILVWDGETPICEGFVNTLKAQAYDLIPSQNFSEVEKLVVTKQVSALVFGADKNTTRIDQFLKLIQKADHFPVLIVASQDSEVEKRFSLNSLRRLVRPLSPKDQFVATLEEMLELSTLRQRLDEAERRLGERHLVVVSDSNTCLDYFDTLKLDVVIDRTLTYFGERLTCRNIHWIEAEEYDRVVRKKGDIEDTQNFTRSMKIRSFHSAAYLCVGELAKLFSEKLRLQDDRPVKVNRGNEYHLLVPVYDDKREKILSYLLVEGLRETHVNTAETVISETLPRMARHLRFSVDHWNALNRAFVDDLTELYNQRYLPMVIDNEIARSRREKLNFTVLFLDIDYFKIVNDTRGHWIGSKVLVELGHLLKSNLRSSDYAFRYGGDEFVIVLVNTPMAAGEVVAERLRKKVEETTFKIDGFDLNVTVSIGLATYPDHARSSEQVIKLADQAMYFGKHKSRNVVYKAS